MYYAVEDCSPGKVPTLHMGNNMLKDGSVRVRIVDSMMRQVPRAAKLLGSCVLGCSYNRNVW